MIEIEEINGILKLNPGSNTSLYPKKEKKEMREFNTGATRDSDNNKLDYEGFLSPYVLHRYAEYMHKHRIQADGKPRASDNWQEGIPVTAYMKSLWRHLMEIWACHRLVEEDDELREDALCAIIFNASGYLHEIMQPTKL